MLPIDAKESTTGHKRVVIVGAGFGGIYAAKRLRYVPVDVTVIDRTNHHLFQPMLYQVATGQLSGDEISSPVRSILSSQKNARVLMEEVTGIDVAQKCVATSDDTIPYDFLIIATGSEYNYFGHDDWAAFAPNLKTLDGANIIRQRILDAFERAEKESEPEQVQERLTFALVGGGPTGVEMAGAIAELAHKTLKNDFRHIDTAKTRILVIEAQDRLLSGFDAHLAEASADKLKQLGVEIRLGAKVTGISQNSITVGDEDIRTSTVIWTAGVKASQAAGWLAAPTDHMGRVVVEPDLTVPGYPEIFVIGDTASVKARRNNFFGLPIPEPSGEKKPLPGLAQPAMQEGEYAAKTIRRRVTNRPVPAPFIYRDKGNLAVIGRSFAIADMGKLKIWGFLGWLVWLMVHIWFLIGFSNRLLVMLEWAIAYFTNQRTGRVISTDFEKKLKSGGAPAADAGA